MSRSGVSNPGFSVRSDYQSGEDRLNNRLEIGGGGFQAYNETFVDDNGLCGDEAYIDFQRDRYAAVPKCRRSIAVVPRTRQLSPGPQIAVGYHQRYRYEAVRTHDDRSPRRSLHFTREPPLYRRHDQFEEYVDPPEDRLALGYREAPVGCSGSGRVVTTPSRADAAILAPMIADVERKTPQKYRLQALATPGVHRGHSLPYLGPRATYLSRGQSFNGEPITPSRRINTAVISPNFRGSTVPLLLTPPRHPPPVSPHKSPGSPSRVSWANLPQIHLMVKGTLLDYLCLQVISPNFRGSTVPLLLTPPRHPPPVSPHKSPGSPSRVSWANLPQIHLPTEMLCCVGFVLLTAGAASTLLCFYLLALVGKRYFLNFGALSGFTSLVLGMLSCRTNKWKWVPHRNYLTGYILLGTFSLLHCACLGGILYALNEGSYPLLDILGGAVCAVSILLMGGALVGMVTSGCCHRPPPDNRVAHSVAGFTI